MCFLLVPHSLVTLANPGVSDWHILHPGASRRNGSIRAGFKDSSVDKGSTESPAPDMSTESHIGLGLEGTLKIMGIFH